MIDKFEQTAIRIWVTLVAVFVWSFLFSLNANASIFPECNPAAEAQSFQFSENIDSWVSRSCEAQSLAVKKLEPKLETLDKSQQELTMATNAGDWQQYRENGRKYYQN